MSRDETKLFPLNENIHVQYSTPWGNIEMSEGKETDQEGRANKIQRVNEVTVGVLIIFAAIFTMSVT